MTIPRVTALVPMKHHSERIPGKNYRLFCGKPLCHWIVESLLNCHWIDRVVVNTDSDRIADEVGPIGATVLMRPEHLRGDMITIQPLIAWDLTNVPGEYFLQTHATNPLVRPATFDSAVNTFFRSRGHDSLFSVTPLHTRLYWADGQPINHDPTHLVRTQDLPEVLEENSCVYIFSRSVFGLHGHRIGATPLLFWMDPLEAIDIDEEHDFAIAESVMNARESKMNRTAAG